MTLVLKNVLNEKKRIDSLNKQRQAIPEPQGPVLHPHLSSGCTPRPLAKGASVSCVPLGVTVSTVWEVGEPWTSGGFLTLQVKVPLSASEALSSVTDASPRAGLPCHRTRPWNWPSAGGKALDEKWKNWKGGGDGQRHVRLQLQVHQREEREAC